jgi:Domain of unknown function (DUF4406)
MEMRIYLAGPMSNVKDFNFPAFDAAAIKLRSEGHKVFSPADHDRENHGNDFGKGTSGKPEEVANTGFSLRRALGDDLAWICSTADAIAMLPGWENSKGANAEHATAKALDLKFIYL